MIKVYRPRFNILLKDDKNYPLLRLSINDPFPRVEIVRQMGSSNYRYFGPYPSIGSSRYLLKLIHNLFPLRDCKQSISLIKHQPKCIKLDLETCLGPCVLKDTKTAYDQLITDLILFLSGDTKKIINQLTTKMKVLSEKKCYEQAAAIRDQLKTVEQFSERQLVQLSKPDNFHVWGFAQDNDMFYALLQQIVDGKLLYQNGFYVRRQPGIVFTEFQYDSILTFYQKPLAKKTTLLTDCTFNYNLSKFNVVVNHPKRGEKKDLLSLANKNARLSLLRVSKSVYDSTPTIQLDTLKHLKRVLSLLHLPIKIFGFDISHLGGTGIVGSAVCFVEGSKLSALYRHFSIRSVVDKSNDPKSIQEAVYRRLKLALRTNEDLPDLLLIDGGKGQLRFAAEAVASLGLEDRVELISLAKKNEEIFCLSQSDPICLSKDDPGLHLLQYIRDESHRFALRYQHYKRKAQYE